jgi:hypothetical protein
MAYILEETAHSTLRLWMPKTQVSDFLKLFLDMLSIWGGVDSEDETNI